MFFARKSQLLIAIVINCMWTIYGIDQQETTEALTDVDDIKDLNLTQSLSSSAADSVADPAPFDIRYDNLPSQCILLQILLRRLPLNCAEATSCTQRSGYYFIQLPTVSQKALLVECDATTQSGDWTVIQKRQDGSVDFYRDWAEYKYGFGTADSEYFIGLDYINALTTSDGTQELLILLELSNGVTGYAKYDDFRVGEERVGYLLASVGKYSGTAGDALSFHAGAKFNTKDRANGLNGRYNCGDLFSGAWWFRNCLNSNLNGNYNGGAIATIYWHTFYESGQYIKNVKMMIRRRKA